MRQIAIKGFKVSKAGKVEKDQRRLDVSARLRQRDSKRVKVARRAIRWEARPWARS